MKKYIFILFGMIISILVSGCGKKDEKKILDKLEKNVENSKSYSLEGDLEIINSEYSYKYDVDVSYKDNDLFKVSLKNKTNNHEQIILKNEEGVFVLTPSLNKSFKFQSDWPFNNSQVYLLQTIVKDIKNDQNKKIEKKDNLFVVTTKVQYSNNKELSKQKIYIDENAQIKKVEVLNDNDEAKMIMNFNKIDLNSNNDIKEFDLKENMLVFNDEEKIKTVSKVKDIIYPMYIPKNTYLTGQNVINKEDGERIILTFSGEKPFVFVQETASLEKEATTIPVSGEPLILVDTVGALSDNSASWVSNNIEYYIASDSLSKEELVSVVQSVSVMPVSK